MSVTVFPLFVGSGRSGTTLFRNVFDSHPDFAMTHEAHFVAPMVEQRSRYERTTGFDIDRFIADLYENPNFVRQAIDRSALTEKLRVAHVESVSDAIRVVFSLYAEMHGKHLYGDKTPGYVNHISMLGEALPEARFVHIIRDGRDVALGYLDRDEWGPSTVGDAALYWRSRVSRGRAAGRSLGPGRYLEVRYEDMVDEPETTTRLVCDFLDLDFHPDMMRFHEKGAEFIAKSNTPEAFAGLAQPITKGMRDWRTEMKDADVALFEAIAGDVLSSLSYERRSGSPSFGLRVKVAAAEVAWQFKRVDAKTRPLLKKIKTRLMPADSQPRSE